MTSCAQKPLVTQTTSFRKIDFLSFAMLTNLKRKRASDDEIKIIAGRIQETTRSRSPGKSRLGKNPYKTASLQQDNNNRQTTS